MCVLLHHPQALYSVDPQLSEHRDHIEYRWGQYQAVKDNIIKAHGSLEEFARVRGGAGGRRGGWAAETGGACRQGRGVLTDNRVKAIEASDFTRGVGVAPVCGGRVCVGRAGGWAETGDFARGGVCGGMGGWGGGGKARVYKGVEQGLCKQGSNGVGTATVAQGHLWTPSTIPCKALLKALVTGV